MLSLQMMFPWTSCMTVKIIKLSKTQQNILSYSIQHLKTKKHTLNGNPILSHLVAFEVIHGSELLWHKTLQFHFITEGNLILETIF
jgi:hypothetical protein